MPLAPQRTEGDTLEAYLRSIRATHEQMDNGKSWSGHERNCVFLNAGQGGRFANMSAVSGLDFLDDARGMAYVDWDHDGDLDVWLSNRTSPRLRLMRNRCAENNSYVALRLSGDGESTNRDAVGARVSLELDNGTRLIRTLRAGEGFLSQSSKWLHFGLGGAGVKKVQVRWPGGASEVFEGVASGGHYRMAQGKGKAVEWLRPGDRETRLASIPIAQPAVSDAARIVLSSRLPMPSLSVRPIALAESAIPLNLDGSPTLINFWASWCAPCLGELAEFKEHSDELQAAGIEIVALSTDGLSGDDRTTAADALKTSNRLGLGSVASLSAWLATPQTLDKIEVIKRFLFDRRIPFSLPASFLIDAEGRLVVIYRGAVSVETLLADVGDLRQSAAARRDASVPLPGRWYTSPSEVNPRAFAKWFEEPFPDEAARLLELNLRQQSALESSVKPGSADQQRIHFERVESYRRLGVIRAAQNRHGDAAKHARAGLVIEPSDAHLRYLRISSLKAARSASELTEQLNAWIEADPNDHQSRLRLAEIYMDAKDFGHAVEQFKIASSIVPDDIYGRFVYGLALVQNGALAEGIDQFARVLKLQPDHREALLNLAAASEKIGQMSEALGLYRKAFELTPESPLVTYKIAQLSATGGDHVGAVEFYRKAIAIRPETARLHEELGLSLLATKRASQAVASFRKAFEIDARRVGAANNAAWILASHPDPGVRDSAVALGLAEKINLLTNHQNPSLLDTFAVALANDGQFAKSAEIARKAIALAEKAGDAGTAASIRERLVLFLKSKPYRDG